VFINGCKANNDTYKTAKIFLTARGHKVDIHNIDIRILSAIFFKLFVRKEIMFVVDERVEGKGAD